MLVLLLGPSGVGKTTLINQLVRTRRWLPIFSFVTRPPRNINDYKVHISDRDYKSLVDHGKMWSDVSQLGAMYGTLRGDIEAALRDDREFHVLDFNSARRSEFFSEVKHLAICILADSAHALEQMLVTAGRHDRVSEAISQHQEFEKLAAQRSTLIDFKFVRNKREDVDSTVAAIQRLAEDWRRSM